MCQQLCLTELKLVAQLCYNNKNDIRVMFLLDQHPVA